MRRLLLLDGNAIMHRAYHALPPLTNATGQQTNAVYGFISMLLRLIQDFHPSHVAVAFDRPEKTFREELFEAYQAHRPHMEEEMSSQFPLVKQVLDAMHIPMYEKAGFEADDVLGTITKEVTQQSGDQVLSDVIVVTGDRDILQLVDEHIRVYLPIKGLSEGKLYDVEAVKEKFFIEPIQIIDYKGLIGDASDNYRGVEGIGPKTAVTLLQKYATVENLYDHVQEQLPAVKEKLIKGEDNARLSKKLATIVRDVPLDIDITGMEYSTESSQELIDVLTSLGFNTLTKRVIGRVDKKGDKKEKQTQNKDQLSLL